MGEENLENEVLLRGVRGLQSLLYKSLENLEQVSKKSLAGVIDLMGVGGKLSPEGFYKFVHLPPLLRKKIMNSNFKFKLLSHLTAKKEDKGFTLIELLVVVIIIGVLAAIALPNLLGQVGKARESEAKSTIGALNRAQQGYYTEKASFATSLTQVEVPAPTTKYYAFNIPAAAIQTAAGRNNTTDGTRDYTGGVSYNTTDRTFATVVCRSTVAPNFNANTGAGALANEAVIAAGAVSCDTANGVETIN